MTAKERKIEINFNITAKNEDASTVTLSLNYSSLQKISQGTDWDVVIVETKRDIQSEIGWERLILPKGSSTQAFVPPQISEESQAMIENVKATT